jgi:hypothetical protein
MTAQASSTLCNFTICKWIAFLAISMRLGKTSRSIYARDAPPMRCGIVPSIM